MAGNGGSDVNGRPFLILSKILENRSKFSFRQSRHDYAPELARMKRDTVSFVRKSNESDQAGKQSR